MVSAPSNPLPRYLLRAPYGVRFAGARSYLIQERWLEVHPGVGTVVAKRPEPRSGERKRLLQEQVEQLVVEAMRVGVDMHEVLEAIEDRWAKLAKPKEITVR